MRNPTLFSALAMLLGAVIAAALLPWVLALSHKQAVANLLKPPENKAQMRLFAGPARVGRPFVVTAYVKDYEPGQAVTLLVPPGLKLVDGYPAQQSVLESKEKPYAQVTWRLTADAARDYRLVADLEGVIAEERVHVHETVGFE